MKKTKTNQKLITILIFLFSLPVLSSENITDYLSIGEKLTFNQEQYNLKWSSHPSENYYKHEYLRSSDKLPQYEKMVLIEAIKGNLTVNQVADFKIQELEKQKINNPTINFQRFADEKSNETIIDFLISDGDTINEWNVYRYQMQILNNTKFIVLYAYSFRGYTHNNNELINYYSFIKENRLKLIEKVKNLKIPKIKPE